MADGPGPVTRAAQDTASGDLAVDGVAELDHDRARSDALMRAPPTGPRVGAQEAETGARGGSAGTSPPSPLASPERPRA
ncbi:hypothetical protein [Georgenia sp. SUBG003]|uniref:hypothetical protein n=1 Tax=Georgenia sp. SUBG003 TaxID=1497974 RepID=UPI003AB12CE8